MALKDDRIQWFACYAEKALAGCSHMTNEEFGLYWRLLMEQFCQQGPLNLSGHRKTIMCRRMNCSEDEFDRAWEIVCHNFERAADLSEVANERMSEEVCKARSRFRRSSAGGRKRQEKASGPEEYERKTSSQAEVKLKSSSSEAQPRQDKTRQDIQDRQPEGECEGESSPRDLAGRKAGDDGSGRPSPSNSCTQQPGPEDEVIFQFDCRRSSEDETRSVYSVSRGVYLKHCIAYPEIDVLAQYRKMDSWLASSPQRMKTRNGMGRFITNWLGRQKPDPKVPHRAPPKPSAAASRAVEERRAKHRAALAEMEAGHAN